MNAIAEELRQIADVAEAGQKPHWAKAMRTAAYQLDLWAREIPDLREDEKRLDWLADKDNAIGNVELPTACVMRNPHSLRAAIDDAMLLTPNVELTGAGTASRLTAGLCPGG